MSNFINDATSAEVKKCVGLIGEDICLSPDLDLIVKKISLDYLIAKVDLTTFKKNLGLQENTKDSKLNFKLRLYALSEARRMDRSVGGSAKAAELFKLAHAKETTPREIIDKLAEPRHTFTWKSTTDSITNMPKELDNEYLAPIRNRIRGTLKS